MLIALTVTFHFANLLCELWPPETIACKVDGASSKGNKAIAVTSADYNTTDGLRPVAEQLRPFVHAAVV